MLVRAHTKACLPEIPELSVGFDIGIQLGSHYLRCEMELEAPSFLSRAGIWAAPFSVSQVLKA